MSTLTAAVTANVTRTGKGDEATYRKVRANGTARRIPLLAAGTEARTVAEGIVAARNEGTTMKAIAADLHVSVPTVRRMINSLLLTQKHEAGQARSAALQAAKAAKKASPTPAFDALVKAGKAEGQRG